MKKIISLSLVVFLVGLGFGHYVIPKGAGPVGAYRVTNDHFVNGFYAGSTDELSVDSSGNVTTSGTITSTNDLAASDDITASDALTGKNLFLTGTGTSSSTPHALTAAKAVKITIPASATTALASSTAVTVNSLFIVTQSATATVPNTTCNSAVASGTLVSLVVPGSGFQLKTQIAPTTNPFCYDVVIIN